MSRRELAKTKDEKLLFRLLFFKSHRNPNIEVVESAEIDFSELKDRIEHKESVFITCKPKDEPNQNSDGTTQSTEPWYFTHI